MKNPTKSRRILVTAGLPYANGPIHIGHLVEYLQADFYTRFQKMRENECLYICGDDTHGAPIMVAAKNQGLTPKELVARGAQEHLKDFKDFLIDFSHYGSTDSVENKELCDDFYRKIQKNEHLTRRPVGQLYCPKDKMFLPDRFVKGSCPNCKTGDQYGDSCDNCGATYSPADMSDAVCSHCGSKPEKKETEHIFFKLNSFKSYLQEWLPEHTSPEITKKMLEWFNEDLRDWDISRDEPYFGFAIPGEVGKYFYVWVDAPMGYISTTAQWCKLNNRSLDDFWPKIGKSLSANSSNNQTSKSDVHPDKSSSGPIQTEIYHFIGKDIVYFHTLFWPSFLKAADYTSPTMVFVHGMLMVNGQKMSKSKGTFIAARTYLNHLDPEYLRYYYGSKLSAGMDDLDLNFDDFVGKVNGDLVGKIANLGSRSAQLLTKKMDGVLGTPEPEGFKLIQTAQLKSESIAAYFDAREFSKALHEIRDIVDLANKYFDEAAPWKSLATNPSLTKSILTTTLNLFRIVCIYLKPIVPKFSRQVEILFSESDWKWRDALNLGVDKKISEFHHLATRIEPEKIAMIIEESKKMNEQTKAKSVVSATTATSAPTATATAATNATAAGTSAATAPTATTVSSNTIGIDDFMKVDLRIGEIVEAEEIKEADKLLRLKVQLGPDYGIRQIIAGIKSAYKPADLVGRKVVVVANLQPRKMKFGMSEGMILAASNEKGDLFVVEPDARTFGETKGIASIGCKVK